jgi:hypothetical protein
MGDGVSVNVTVGTIGPYMQGNLQHYQMPSA